jgi:hypothetical protein
MASLTFWAGIVPPAARLSAEIPKSAGVADELLLVFNISNFGETRARETNLPRCRAGYTRIRLPALVWRSPQRQRTLAMSRMSREFSLVLLGGGILTAGYFYFRDDSDLLAKGEEQAKNHVSGSHGHMHGPLVFLHGGGYSSGRASSALGGGVTRGGFGGFGVRAGG